jgi:hypothetical protein
MGGNVMRPRKFQFDDSRLSPASRAEIYRWRAEMAGTPVPECTVVVVNYYPPINEAQVIREGWPMTVALSN